MASQNRDRKARKMARAVGEVNRQQRKALGKVSQEDFSEMSGHHRTYIGNIERGDKVPTIYTVHLVGKALGVKASEILKKAGY